MKRWTFRIVLCLLFGVVTTVGVAWGCAAFAKDVKGELVVFPFDESIWAIGGLAQGPTHGRLTIYSFASEAGAARSARTGPRRIVRKPRWSRGVEWAKARHTEDGICFQDVRGWPLQCMWWTFRWDASTGTVSAGTGTYPWYVDPNDTVILLPNHNRTHFSEIRALPLTPVWPEFLINTLLYGGIWFALIFGWRAHMRVIRRWQGHCPMCKYDLRGDLDTGCPECGWNREP